MMRNFTSKFIPKIAHSLREKLRGGISQFFIFFLFLFFCLLLLDFFYLHFYHIQRIEDTSTVGSVLVYVV
jgi:hypothetical protein